MTQTGALQSLSLKWPGLRQLKPEPRLLRQVYENMQGSRRHFGGRFGQEMLFTLRALAPHCWLVKDDGIIMVVPLRLGEAEVHISFWTGRMRGYEEMCRDLAASLPYHHIWATVPLEARTVRAFAKRVGFQVVWINEEKEILCLRLH